MGKVNLSNYYKYDMGIGCNSDNVAIVNLIKIKYNNFTVQLWQLSSFANNWCKTCLDVHFEKVVKGYEILIQR